jgi:pyridoxal phosphate phosphatase PHOSPHO2
MNNYSTDKESTTTSSLPVDLLFVWDFDWTIVNCNSDEYIPAAFLGTDETERRLRAAISIHGPTKWHNCISDIINQCMEECSCDDMDDDVDGKISKVLNVAAKMPYLADVRGALTDIHDCKSLSTGQAIISDGNNSFIGAFVKDVGIEQYFTHGIETNIGVWTRSKKDTPDDAADAEHKTTFSVVHQSSKYGGHSCKSCPPNLCKSQVLLDILNRTSSGTTAARPRVVYVGDGSNDACPALNVLGPNDVLLARTGRRINNPNSKIGEQADVTDDKLLLMGNEFPILSTIESRKKKEGLVPCCLIHSWNTGAELRALVQDILYK